LQPHSPPPRSPERWSGVGSAARLDQRRLGTLFALLLVSVAVLLVVESARTLV
jgi:hypothetical protein